MGGAGGGWMAYVGLGGNLPFAGDAPEATLRAAVTALSELGRVAAASGLWRTEPVGPVRDQPAFVNGAVALWTGMPPVVLLEKLLDLEARFGRVRGAVAKGPRTLDLDLLLLERWQEGHGAETLPGAATAVVCDEPKLRLPHPEMARRRFVLAPLAEIAPGLRHPLLGKTVAALLAELPGGEQVERIEAVTAIVGRLEVITGPMFSGKSEELIRRLRRAEIARLRTRCFKPRLDARYAGESIASHSHQTLAAVAVGSVGEMAELLRETPVDVVGMDEAQFFEDGVVALAMRLVGEGVRVVIAGLDMTYAGEPFGPAPQLMALADEVLKLSAVCTVCGAAAVHSQRLSGNKDRVMVGAAEAYEARCRAHFYPGGDGVRG